MSILSMSNVVPFLAGVLFAMFVWPWIQTKWAR